MKQVSDNTYRNFTPSERLALFWAAMGRGDEAEADKLNDTCPRAKYMIDDPHYFGALRAVMEMCMYAQLRMAEINTGAAISAAMLLSTADDDEAEQEKWAEKYAALVANILAIWAAWTEFCQSIGIDGASVMRTFRGGELPAAITFASSPEIRELADPDQEQKCLMADFFRHRWDRHLENTKQSRRRLM